MKSFIILFLGINATSAVTHSLKYFYTGSTGIEGFPQFVAVGIVDGMHIDYFDSVSEKNILKQSWMEGARDEKRTTDVRKGIQQTFIANIKTAMSRFNQTTGVHICQRMYGCEWDDDTGVTEGFYQDGYDGEDFIAFDLKTKTWIAPKPQAVITKHKWDSDKAYNEQKKNYLTQECIDWLKKYVDYGKSTLMRTVPPSVSLLQETPSSPVTCHATGFYPSGVMVFWQKDGQEQHGDVENGETLPNDDGTFQKRSHLTVKPEELKNNKYQCVVQVTGIKEDFIKVLTESEIQTNRDEPPPIIVLIIGVLVALLLVINVVGVVIWKKKSEKDTLFQTAEGAEEDSNSIKTTEIDLQECNTYLYLHTHTSVSHTHTPYILKI